MRRQYICNEINYCHQEILKMKIYIKKKKRKKTKLGKKQFAFQKKVEKK